MKNQEKENKGILWKLGKPLEHHKTGFVLLKIVHKVDSSAIPLRIINAVINVTGAYLGLYLTARLIDLLLDGKYADGFFWGCLMVATELLFGITGGLVEKAYARSSQRCALAFAVMMREKSASLDYETMEQPQVTDKIFLSERIAGMYGGLGAVVNTYQGLLTGLLEIATAVGMISVLCFSRPAVGGSLLALAAQPAVSVFLLALFLGLTIAARIRAGASMVRNTKKYLQDHTGMEMKLTYLLDRVMMNLRAAKIIRIYDMKKMLMDNIRKCDEESNKFYGEMCKEEIRDGLR